MNDDEILSKAEKHSAMIAGWVFSAQGIRALYREAYFAGMQNERKACIELCQHIASKHNSIDNMLLQNIMESIQLRGNR
jgi:hypothetical protein